MADKTANEAPTERRPEESVQQPGPSREPLRQQDDVADDDVFDEVETATEQPSIIKALRTQAKIQTTKLVNKTKKAIGSRSSRTLIKEYRSQLVDRLQECVELNDRLARAETQSGTASQDYRLWITEVETTVNSCYMAIDEYLRSRAGSAAPSVVASVAPSARSHASAASSRASHSSRLQTVRQERLLAELELDQLQRNAEEEQEDERRLRELEKERQQLLKKRKQRELRDLIEKQRVEEEILATTLEPAVAQIPNTSIPPPILPPIPNFRTVATLGNNTALPAPNRQSGATLSTPLTVPCSTNYPIAPPPATANEAWIYSMDAPPARSSHRCGGTQLQKVNMIRFSGKPKDWPMFISTFRSMVHDVQETDDQRLAVLRTLLEPNVRKGVAGALNFPILYRRALEKLHRKYGHPHLVTKSCLRSVLKYEKFKDYDYAALEGFSQELYNAVDTLIASGHHNELMSSALIEQIKDKLPTVLKREWGEEIERLQPRAPSLLDFDAWLETKVSSANHIRSPPDSDDSEDEGSSHKAKPARAAPRQKRRERTPKVLNVLATGREVHPDCVHCKKLGHAIADCRSSRAMAMEERYNRMKEKGLCFRCLGQGHRVKDCSSDAVCGENGCKSKHHPILNRTPRFSRKEETKHVANSDQHSIAVNNVSSSKTENSCPESSRRKETLLCVVPVQLRANGRHVNTFALLDPGSEETLVRQDAARQLRLKGPMLETEFTTYRGRDPTTLTQTVDFQIASLDGDNVFEAEGATAVPELVSTIRRRNIPHLKKSWSHLQDLPLNEAEPGEVTVYIGTDVPEALEYNEIRKPPRGVRGPHALHTPFGWSLRGPIQSSNHVGPERRHVMKVSLGDLHESVKAFWTTETLGVQPPKQKITSEADTLALWTLDSTVRHVGDRYEAGLLWSSPKISLPDNRGAALRRFFALERKLKLNPELAESYTKTIQACIEDGHARKLSPLDLGQHHPRTWWLPHHAVTNPNKPGKVRVVFDAAAETDGVSLNDALMTGPDLLNNLLGVLLRFREFSVAVSADITSMFHQVKVVPSDRHAPRFFWRTPGTETPPQTHEMTVQIFGAKSSPTVCNFVLRKTAQDHATEYPNIVTRVKRNFYMNDYLDSMPVEEEAIQICHDLKEVHLRGGFPLTKWKSSSRKVLGSFPAEDRVDPEMDLDLDRLPVERTLGVWWNAETDEFAFRVKRVPAKSTKREILRIVASVFDPIGFLVPVTLNAKSLLQELWKLELSWDQEIPTHLAERWSSWLAGLEKLEAVTIPRCLHPFRAPSSMQLHVFADASELAFGTVAYLRVSYEAHLEVKFVTAKSRIAPLRQLTIPRLELQGALLAARMVQTIVTELRLEINKVFLWTDSSTVLKWIRSKTCKFKAFVAYRITEILELTEVEQWKHVPGKLNPADDCSRGLDTSSMISPNRWFNGPAFLRQPDSEWPAEQNVGECDSTDPEVSQPMVANLKVDRSEPLDVIRSTSNLHRLKRILSWVLRFTRNTRPLKFPVRKGPLTVVETRNALSDFIKLEQKRLFSPEYIALDKKRLLPRCSSLLKLTPFLDERGIMRVGEGSNTPI